MIDRRVGAGLAGDERIAGRAVDRVVDRGRAVRIALDGAGDHVGALGRQARMREPGRCDIGEQNAGLRRGRERGDQFAPLRPAQVDGDRALALVQPGPVEAAPARRDRPAQIIDAAADHLDADHVGAILRERQAAHRRGDERRTFDHANAVQKIVGHVARAFFPVSRQFACRLGHSLSIARWCEKDQCRRSEIPAPQGFNMQPHAQLPQFRSRHQRGQSRRRLHRNSRAAAGALKEPQNDGAEQKGHGTHIERRSSIAGPGGKGAAQRRPVQPVQYRRW